MDYHYAQKIKELIQKLKAFDFDGYIKKSYVGVALKEVCFREYNAVEFKKLLFETLERLERLVKSDVVYILPESMPNHEYLDEGGDIEDELGKLLNSLREDKKSDAGESLKKIILYILIYGSWDKTIEYPSRIKQKEVDELSQELNLIQSKLEQEVSLFGEKFEEYKTAKEELDALIAETKEEIKSISDSKATIEEHLESAQDNRANIDEINTSISELKEEIEENIKNYQKEFGKVVTQNSGALERAIKAKEIMKEIQSKEKEINMLLGKANDGSLGAKFNERQESLQKYSLLFARLSIAGLIGTAIWTYIVFQDFDGKDWSGFGINMIRTFPAWFLVWWLIGRYTSERKLQEEYAFKAAVAMSMRNHSDLLSESDNGSQEERASRQIMLQKAMDNIYKNPNDKKEKRLNISPKSLNNFLKQFNELIKEVKK